MHPEYNQPVYQDFDVALVQLYTPITFVKNVKAAVKLAKVGEVVHDATKVFISGWGLSTATATGPSTKLRGVIVDTTSQLTCIWAYCNVMEITTHMICATSSGKEACRVSLCDQTANSNCIQQ